MKNMKRFNVRGLKQDEVAQGVSAHGVFGTDVAAGDRRSVRAWLSGKGDQRMLCWRLFCRLYHPYRKSCRHEVKALAYGKLCRAFDGFCLQLKCDRDMLAQAIAEHGLLTATVRFTIERFRRKWQRLKREFSSAE